MRRIIVGFDGSEEARDALHYAGRLARLDGAELDVAAVGLFEPQISTAAEAQDAAASRRALFDDALAELRGRSFKPRIVEGLPAARGLISLADDEDADLIVVGSTHRGRLGRVFPGSVGAQLLRDCPCAVAIAPRGFRRAHAEVHGVIGLAYDGSHEADLALAQAMKLAQLLQVRLRLIAVATGSETDWERVLEEGRTRARKLDAEAVVLEGDPGPALVEACGDLDMVVVGSRARGRLRRTLLGSVSAHLCCNAACPVIVVPRDSEPHLRTVEAVGAAGAVLGAAT